nr:MAG TPA: hypothetical protein [Caudoviricetes sp.]
MCSDIPYYVLVTLIQTCPCFTQHLYELCKIHTT